MFNWFYEPNFKNVLFQLAWIFDASPVSLFVSWCSSPRYVRIQPHTCACNMYIISRFVIGSSGGLIIMAHTSPYLFRPPSSFKYNSHTLKSGSVLAYFMRILNSCVVYKFQTVKLWVSAIPAIYFLYSTAIWRDIRAAWYFCSCEQGSHCWVSPPRSGTFESIRVSRFNY